MKKEIEKFLNESFSFRVVTCEGIIYDIAVSSLFAYTYLHVLEDIENPVKQSEVNNGLRMEVFNHLKRIVPYFSEEMLWNEMGDFFKPEAKDPKNTLFRIHYEF